MNHSDLVAELRDLIVRAAPEPKQAEPVRDCDEDALLDEVIPFSSLIVLGTVVAIEHRFGLRITRKVLEQALVGGVTLGKLATMVKELEGSGAQPGREDTARTVDPSPPNPLSRPPFTPTRERGDQKGGVGPRNEN